MVEQHLQLELAVFIRTYFCSGMECDVGTGGTGRLSRLAVNPFRDLHSRFESHELLGDRRDRSPLRSDSLARASVDENAAKTETEECSK